MNFLFALLAASSGTFLLRFLVALHRESKAASRASVRVRFVGRDLPKAVGKIVALDRNFGQKSTRRLARKVVIGLLATTFLGLLLHAQDNPREQPASAQEVRELRQLVQELQAKVAKLESQRESGQEGATSQPKETPDPPAAQQLHNVAQLSADDRGVLDFFRGTSINLGMDGYYGYNFNQPVGRVNLLRAYDVSSNSFSLNQASLVIERAPDIAAGRRFGARLDLQYGQATETLQGSATNELRPQTYRPLFQGYGTYVVPVGNGLTLDFGKWASAIGIENNYTKDQMNYSRSYYFNFLPFCHMGVRATYQFNNWVTLAYAVVNGTQQTEDFNRFKSQMIFLTLRPRKTVSWNINYYGGQEQRDVVPVLNPGSPSGPTQSGLPNAQVVPTADGRLHIFDSYLTWTATPKLTLAAEGDYVISRVSSHSTPSHVSGVAGYALPVHAQSGPGGPGRVLIGSRRPVQR